jgi:N-acetylneuraminate synthase
VARTGKPIIISTGMASAAELDEAVRAVRLEGNDQLVLLKCTSTYPATPNNSNLATIPHMKELFGTEIGLSDHTMGIGVSVAAVTLGATVIEKHFTTSRAEGGVDASFSMEPHELRMLVEETERAWQSIGHIQYGPTEAEKPSVANRRSLYIGEDMKAGDVFTEKNLRNVRPGLGLETKYYDLVLGKKIKADAAKGTALSWELLL